MARQPGISILLLVTRFLQLIKVSSVLLFIAWILHTKQCDFKDSCDDKSTHYFLRFLLAASILSLPLVLFLSLKEIRSPKVPEALRHPTLHGLVEALAIAGWLALFLWAVNEFKDTLPSASACSNKTCNAWPFLLLPALMGCFFILSLILSCLPAARQNRNDNKKKQDEEKKAGVSPSGRNGPYQQRPQGTQKPSPAFVDEHRGNPAPATYTTTDGRTVDQDRAQQAQATQEARDRETITDPRDRAARLDDRDHHA